MSIRELATCPAIVCSPTTTVERAAYLMSEANIGLLCVADGGKPVGVLTDRDIVVRNVGRSRSADSSVADIMSHPAVCVSEHAAVDDAAQVMGDHRCRRVVMVDDLGRVAGVLSLDDVLRSTGDRLRHVVDVVRGPRHSHEIFP